MEDAKILLQNFTRTTSCHGIPQIGYSRTLKGRFFWAIVFSLCLSVFTNQAMSLIRKYKRHEKAVTVELTFEAVPFPAVTICNLNPYKNSLVQNVAAIRRSLNAFDNLKMSSKTAAHQVQKRQQPEYVLQPVMAFCNCTNINSRCKPFLKPLTLMETKCLCFKDINVGLVACYNEKMWTTLECYKCAATGRCPHPSGRVDEQELDDVHRCMCPAVDNFCVIKPEEIPVIGNPMWFTSTSTSTTTTTTPSTTTPTTTTTTTSTTSTTTTTTTTTPTTTTSTTTESTTTTTPPYTGPTTEDYRYVQALGYEGVTDGVAMATLAKENLVFIIATLDMETRINLSYTKMEMMRMCSFNGKQCDIEYDFDQHVDPTYGNCYTFNYMVNTNRTSGRAGPMYGLRVLVYSNISDYMSTTEAAGVRIQIHNQNEQPFPDTFGYNAPLGFISSFGIKMKKIHRMETFGDCVMDGPIDKYIYNRTYSTEGCFRSCFQHFVIKKCGCGDPRFPVPANQTTCAPTDAQARDCLNKIIWEMGGFHGIQDCKCWQPCKQSGYTVSYSAAKWPADMFKIGDCDENSTERCVEEYRNNAGLLEIYYEQLNYESLDESEAYGIVNLLADFGGQLGLWLGFSVITCVEITLLVGEIFSLLFGHQADQVLWSRSTTMKGIEHKPTESTAWMLEGPKNLLVAKKRLPNDWEKCNCHETPALEQKFHLEGVQVAGSDSENYE